MARSGSAAAKRGARRVPATTPAPQALGVAAGREALALERLVHDRTRLGILSALAVRPSLRFAELKSLLETTDGNLSVHARRLEEADYVTCTKSFEGRVPRTEFSITVAGRKALETYLRHMEAIIRATRA